MWTQCTREWREAEEEAAREEAEEGPNPFSHSRRYARMCKDHVDWELLNLALRIYFEGDFSEKHRMPHPSEPPIAFVRWAKGEVNEDQVEITNHEGKAAILWEAFKRR